MIEFFRLVQATQRTTYKSEAAALVEFLESLMGRPAVIVGTLGGYRLAHVPVPHLQKLALVPIQKPPHQYPPL